MSSEKNDPTVSGKFTSASLKDEEFTTPPPPDRLKRQLKNRHVAMIRHVSLLPTSLLILIVV